MASTASLPTADTAVSVQGLTKHYKGRTAVDGLSFEIPTGVVAGFIGPNGAGKTTTMAMLLGLVHPSSGNGLVLGGSLDDPAAYLERVGALIESPSFWPGLTGLQNLEAMATLGGHDHAGIPDVLDLVGLADRATDRFGTYSFGMKQRVGIASALLGDPKLLVLDEPTNGLDPVGINEMRQLISRAGHGERTVLVSSHILSELEQICDWLIVIDHGSLVYQGPAAGFLDQSEAVVVIAPERDADLDRLALLVRAEGHTIDAGHQDLTVAADGGDPRALAGALNRLAVDHDIVLVEVHVRRPTLESHYLDVVEGARS